MKSKQSGFTLVEIAIVGVAAPIDADEVTAHHAVKIGGLIGVLQEIHVVLELAF